MIYLKTVTLFLKSIYFKKSQFYYLQLWVSCISQYDVKYEEKSDYL